MNPMQWIYIYGLIDPESGELRYIGKSIDPKSRLANHMREVSNCHRSHWIQSLKAKGMKPDIVIIESIRVMWPRQVEEKYWIKYFRDRGFNLVNNTDGGDGVPGLPEETRKKISSTWKGQKHTPESVEKIKASLRGRKASDETREKMSQAHSGRTITWGEKISESLRKLTAEDVQEILRRLQCGERVGRLAKEYGVHRTTLSKIKMGTYHDGFGTRDGKNLDDGQR